MDKCIICGQQDYVVDTKKFPAEYCSYGCYEQALKFKKPPNTKCENCGIPFYKKPSYLKKIKKGISCSKKCTAELRKKWMLGEGNHQFGLIGPKNASYKKSELLTNYGYIIEYCPNHPYPHDKSTKTVRVLQHRLVVEKNYKLFEPHFFEEIDNKIVLKQEYDVHHINEDKTDNRIENLKILTRSEHSSLHNSQKKLLRDNLGRIIGVSKLP